MVVPGRFRFRFPTRLVAGELFDPFRVGGLGGRLPWVPFGHPRLFKGDPFGVNYEPRREDGIVLVVVRSGQRFSSLGGTFSP